MAAAVWSLMGGAQATPPYGRLTFVEPTATVGAHDQIDVLVRLTLDPASPDLLLSSGSLAGFDPADLPTQGRFVDPDTGVGETRDFAVITGAYLTLAFGCSDTFSGGCNRDTTNYTYSFFLNSEPGKPSLAERRDFALAAGASYDFVLAQFTPSDAGAQPGGYRFWDASVGLRFEGVDAQGNALKSSYYPFASTSGSTPFTRVVAVPEPGTLSLAMVGLLGVVAAWQRRGTARA